MARKKKASKSSKKKEMTSVKVDTSAATSGSSLDDTVGTGDEEQHHREAETERLIGVYEVDNTLLHFFPEMTSEILKNYITTEERQRTYNEFREMIDSLARQGFPVACISVTFIMFAIGYFVNIEAEKGEAAEITDILKLPDMMEAKTAWFVFRCNWLLQLEPAFALYNRIESWMGFISAALFTILVFRIAFVCKRSAKHHIRDVLCYTCCVYVVVPAVILMAATCLTALWMHKVLQLINYHRSQPCVTMEAFISLQFVCQGAFEHSTDFLLAIHRLTIFQHRYYSGVHYAEKFGVPTDKWRILTFLYVYGEAVLLIAALKIAKCYLILSILVIFLDEIMTTVESCFRFIFHRR